MLMATSILSFGYNKKNHAIITRCAIEFLNKYVHPDFITEAEANKIIKGNVSEDRNLFKHAIRLWNQHFYNPLKPIEFWKRSKSIDVRFERIAKRWFNRIGSDKYFNSIGEIIHHIQDCTNPAHVVPVFHGGILKDNFDEQDITPYLPGSITIDTNSNYVNPFLIAILKPVALQTLAALHDPFKVHVEQNDSAYSQTIDWAYYWQSNPNGWFGKYGLLGNNYLKENIVLQDVKYTIVNNYYAQYSSKQIEMAVLRTAEFIYFAKKRLQVQVSKKQENN